MSGTGSAVAIDIGGSGVRAARVRISAQGRAVVGDVTWLGKVDSVEQLASRLAGWPCERVGVSVAGRVDSSLGLVLKSATQPWTEGLLALELTSQLGSRHVAVVNDGEAHALAHLALVGVQGCPMLSLAFGTSVAFGMANDEGDIARPRHDTNWEIGDLVLRSRSPGSSALWWLLGANGLRELESSSPTGDALARFGTRIGGLLHNLTILFQPRTIVLTGGMISKHGDVFLPAIERELRASLPAHVEWPSPMLSPYAHASGLVGAAVAALADS